MNYSHGTVAAASPEPHQDMGVYRSRKTIRGRPVWFAIGPTGDYLDIEIVEEGVSEYQVADRMIQLVYGADEPIQRHLALVRDPEPIAARAETVRFSPALLARIFRSRPRGESARADGGSSCPRPPD